MTLGTVVYPLELGYHSQVCQHKNLDSVPRYRVYNLSKGDAMTSTLTIGKLAKAGGVNIQTVRYYERRKLLRPKAKRPSGYRLYDDESLRRLHFIKNAQTLGFTLNEVGELLNLRVNAAARCGDVQRRAQAKLVQVKAKLGELRTLAHALQAMIQTCKNRQPTDRCQILKSLENAPTTQRLRQVVGSGAG